MDGNQNYSMQRISTKLIGKQISKMEQLDLILVDIVYNSKFKIFPSNVVLVRQNQECNKIVFIKSGRCRVLRRLEFV